jgi:Fe-S cluster assembly protein SufD
MNADVRTMKTPAEQALSATFEQARGTLPGKGAVSSLRESAFARFDAQGLPHRRVEEWKFTDLRALMREALPLAALPDAAAKARAKNAAIPLAGIEARRLVFVDGSFVPELSDLAPEAGLEITSLAAALGQGDKRLAAELGKAIECDDVAVALNTALMGDGAVIRVAAGTALKRPLHLIFVAGGGKPSASFMRSLVTVGEGAQATLIESHDSGADQVNAALELKIGDGAAVDYLKTTRGQGLHVSTLLALIGAKATFNSFAFNADAHVLRNQMFVRFAGEGTKAALRGVSLLKSKEHVDTTLLIDHAAGHCESREQFRSVLDGESRAVFQGKIVVEPHAQKTDAKMMTRALMLSDDAEADNKPELEIFADDVICGHGATTAALDEGLKFYLMSRGIPEKEAEALLIRAFVGESIEDIGNEAIREALMFSALKWLGARG